jgi:hypothetical protein
LFPCNYDKEQNSYGYSCYTYFKDGYRKYGPAVPHSRIYKKLKPYRSGIERTFALVKENRYRMEISNRYKGIENVTIHAIEHGKKGDVLNLLTYFIEQARPLPGAATCLAEGGYLYMLPSKFMEK